MGILGIFTGVLIFLPIGGAQLQVVPAFWLVMMGILFLGRWSKGDPPAWAAGEARPWPSAAQARAERQGERPPGGGRAAKGDDVAPAPTQRAQGSSSRKRRKRKARG
jgi:hypothetical protein